MFEIMPSYRAEVHAFLLAIYERAARFTQNKRRKAGEKNNRETQRAINCIPYFVRVAISEPKVLEKF